MHNLDSLVPLDSFYSKDIIQYLHISILTKTITIAATKVAKHFLFLLSLDNFKASKLIKQQNDRNVNKITPQTDTYSTYVLTKPPI
jgi:hypothetical protein